MSPRPWYKRYPSDAIHGMLSLTLEEKGAYTVVLDLIYDRKRGIADNPQYIAGVCGCSVRKWNSIRESLISKEKLYPANGLLHNSRADSELVKTSKISRKRAESGAKGGYNSGETRRRSSKTKDLAEANTLVRARVPETTSTEKSVTTSHEKRTARGSRVPDDWLPRDVDLRWAMEKYGHTTERLQEIVAEFVDYWLSESGQRATKLNWNLTFKNRIRYLGRSAKLRAGPTSVATVAQELLQEKADASNGRTDHGKADGPVIDLADEDYGTPRGQSGPRRLLRGA